MRATYSKRLQPLKAAFIWENLHAKWFFDGSHVKVICKMSWFMEAWLTLCKLDALREKRLEEKWKLVLESSKHDMGVTIFSSAKQTY